MDIAGRQTNRRTIDADCVSVCYDIIRVQYLNISRPIQDICSVYVFKEGQLVHYQTCGVNHLYNAFANGNSHREKTKIVTDLSWLNQKLINQQDPFSH